MTLQLDHADNSNLDAALDIIFDEVDEMLLAGEYDRVNRLLAEMSTDAIPVELLIGVLTATLPARNQLPNRASFLARVEQTLRDRGELEDGLLGGLG